jgi:DNA-binding Lrp family transcriptional regulator
MNHFSLQDRRVTASNRVFVRSVPDQGTERAPPGPRRAFGIGIKNKYGFMAGFRENSGLMNPVIKLLLEGGGLSTAQMAQVLNLSEAEVNRQLEQLKKERILLGWRPVLNLSEEDTGVVRAVIEVRITPERGGGFNRLAERISRFDEVESCYLMSGGYDLLVFVSGSSLQKVAAFVSEKLSTVDGVLSTATHFMLRSDKEHGFLLDVKSEENSRLKVTP